MSKNSKKYKLKLLKKYKKVLKDIKNKNFKIQSAKEHIKQIKEEL